MRLPSSPGAHVLPLHHRDYETRAAQKAKLSIIISLIYLRTECTRVCSAVKNKSPEFDWSRSMRHWAVVAARSRKSVCFLSRLKACGTLSPSWARSLFNITSLPKTSLLTHWLTLKWTTAMSKMIQGERWIKAKSSFTVCSGSPLT